MSVIRKSRVSFTRRIHSFTLVLVMRFDLHIGQDFEKDGFTAREFLHCIEMKVLSRGICAVQVSKEPIKMLLP